MRRLGPGAVAAISAVMVIFTGTGAILAEAASRGAYSESAQFLPITDVFAEEEARAGYSVDVDGPTAVLGAPLADVVNISLESDAGVVFVHFWDGFSWEQQQRLTSDDADADDHFGWAVGISGDTVVVGAPQDDDAGLDAGAVYVFVRSGSTWTEQAKLTASDAAANDRFGDALAIDGDTVVVGAQEDDNGAFNDAGAIYVFVRSGTSWSQQAKLVPSDVVTGIKFGNAVSVDGDTVIAGCRLDNDKGVGSGSAYFYYRIGTTWISQGKVTASDGAAYDNFGSSVAVAVTRAAVGAPLNSDHGGSSGSAYVFVKSGSTWVQETKLTAGDAAEFEEFGRSVAMDGSWLAVGARYNHDGTHYGYNGSVYSFTRTGPSLVWTETDEMAPTGLGGYDQFGHDVAVSGNRIIGGWHMHDRSGATNVGSAAVFYRSGETWPEQAQLYPDDAAADDRFGYSVSVDGDTAAVGSGSDDHGGMANAGSVSVFENTGGSWGFQQRLFAGDASTDAAFGSVAVSGDLMIVGAGGDDDNGTQSGAAYAFLRTGSTWAQLDKMTASDGAEYDHFGWAVDIDANIAVIGAYGGDVGADSSGVAYVFTGPGSSWTEDAKLVPPDPGHGDYFGVTVAVSGTTIAVGAPQDDDHGSLSGSVYIYVRLGSIWYFHSKLTASDADEFDRFGWSVALSGDTLLVGAYNDEAVAASGGSAYVFTRSGDTWSEQAKLLASSYTGGDNFGMGVALDGDTAAIGARYHDVGPGYMEGAVFIFDRDGGVWTEQQIVTTSDHSTLDSFGQVVSVSPTVLLGGAQRREMNDTEWVGAAYVFDRTLDCNLFVIKDDGLSSVTVGQEITYTIVAGNEGSGDALGSTITDTFPGDLIDCSWTCFVGGGATCTPGPVSGDIVDTPDLPVGGEATYTATCTVGPAAAGTLSNTVTVTPPPGVIDSDPSDNTATDLDSVIPDYDFGDAPDPTYPTLLANGGASHVIVPGMYMGATVDAEPDGQPTATADGDDSDGSDDEDLFGATPVVTAGEVVVVPMQVSGSGNAFAWIDTNHDGDWNDAADLMFNNVWLTSGATDVPMVVPPGSLPGFTTARVRFSTQLDLGPTGPAPDGEVEDYQVEIVALADLAILKTNGQTTSAPGEVVSYQITVITYGPSDAPGSTVVDVFPPELTNCTWTCIPFSDATCTPSGTGDINDTVHLGAGGSLTYTAQCTVAQGVVGTLTNTATVIASPGVTDPTPGNNSATDIDTIVPVADLYIDKDNEQIELVETHDTNYLIWVINQGPSDVVAAEVDDVFPPELTDCQWACFPFTTGADCTQTVSSGDIHDLATIPAGGLVVYAAGCTVAASSGICENTATVAPPAGTTDPDLSDNSSTDSDPVSALADFIFKDDFETGDTTAWATTVPPIVLTKARGEIDSDRHRLAFRLDLEALQPVGKFRAPVAAGFDADGDPVYVLHLRRDQTGFSVRAMVWADDGSSVATAWVALPRPGDDIELRWTRSLPGLADGRVELVVDGLDPAVLEGLDNANRGLVEAARGVTRGGAPVTVDILPAD